MAIGGSLRAALLPVRLTHPRTGKNSGARAFYFRAASKTRLATPLPSTYDDPNDLLVVTTADPVGQCSHGTNDYRVLQPTLITDPNGNQRRGPFRRPRPGRRHGRHGQDGRTFGDSFTGFHRRSDQAQIDGFYQANDPHTWRSACWARPPPESSMTSSDSGFARSRPERSDTMAAGIRSHPRARDHVSDLAVWQPDQDSDHFQLLRRIRPRNSEKNSVRAWTRRRRRSRRESALGGQRLDHLQQQRQAGAAIRTVL